MKTFLAAVLAVSCLATLGSSGAAQDYLTTARVPAELSFTAAENYADPFNEVTLDVLVTDAAGAAFRVPAFWAGGADWKARYSSPLTGRHGFRTESNKPGDRGLHNVRGSIVVAVYSGLNPLYRGGPIRIAPDRRHFENAAGEPFFWLGDTWWMGLCNRLGWPDEFTRLAIDRREKGFTVIQIVAGLYPDMPPFDPRGANEAGFPWEKDYTRIRPEYFDMADRRIRLLVDEGLAPCIVGAWGYFLPWMGVEKAKQHWRNLVARYGAYPVLWCVAGEANLPYYLAKGFPYDDREQVRGWTEVARYVRDLDPFRRPLSIHPTGLGKLSARGAIDDATLLDFDMLQTGHGGREILAPTIRTLRSSRAAEPRMPVLNSEVSYEMLLDRIPADIQRLMFWTSMLSGAAGHTYGANGIWQVNRKGQPHGNSPHGGNYGTIPWDEAMLLPGSEQLGLGKKLLLEFPWFRLEPRLEAVSWDDAPAAAAQGRWIWYPEGQPARDAPAEARFFRRSFVLPDRAEVRRAVLRISADDRYTAWINGVEAGSGTGWNPPGRHSVRELIKPGRNVLAVRAENLRAPVPQNPAGLIAGLTVEPAGAPPVSFATDAQWKASRSEAPGWRDGTFDDAGWAPAADLAEAGGGPWGPLDLEDRYWAPYAACADDRLWIIYIPEPRPVRVQGLAPGAVYRATRMDPAGGRRSGPEEARPGAGGVWSAAPPEKGSDWVLILERG